MKSLLFTQWIQKRRQRQVLPYFFIKLSVLCAFVCMYCTVCVCEVCASTACVCACVCTVCLLCVCTMCVFVIACWVVEIVWSAEEAWYRCMASCSLALLLRCILSLRTHHLFDFPHFIISSFLFLSLSFFSLFPLLLSPSFSLSLCPCEEMKGSYWELRLENGSLQALPLKADYMGKWLWLCSDCNCDSSSSSDSDGDCNSSDCTVIVTADAFLLWSS